jgi:hypothetical protein
VHTHGSAGRRRGKARSRILYWFRTPPGVRIGRSALDEDAIRLIEQHNPDVEFDWTRILKGQDGSVEARPPSSQDRRTPARPRDLPARRPDDEHTGTGPSGALVSEEPQPSDSRIAEPDDQPTDVSADTATIKIGETDEPAEVEVIEQFLAEPRVETPAPRPHAGDAISAVESRLGSEGLSRLRARYSEVMARISETVSDPARQEELKTQAERLNPDTWVTEAEVNAGLESYESVFESLRSVVGHRRRRRRRSSDRRRGGPGQPAASPESNDERDSQDNSGEAGEDQ